MLRPKTWPCPGSGDEYALVGEAVQSRRMLIVPALFDEANRMRHFTIEVMRELEALEIDTCLPDFGGCNESLAHMVQQTLTGWRDQAQTAAEFFGATHVLTIRAGAMIAPEGLPCLRYAPVATSSVLRSLLRARVISDQEAGRSVTRDALLEQGMRDGLSLSGYTLNAKMLTEMQDLTLPDIAGTDILQSDVGGGGLWLRAEPGHDPQQAKNLAKIIAGQIR